MVPNSWSEHRLGDIASKIGSGSTPKGGSSAYKSFGVPLLRSQNILWGSLALDDVAYIDSKQHSKMKGSSVLKGDVLLNITGASIGRAAVSTLNEANHIMYISARIYFVYHIFLNLCILLLLITHYLWFNTFNRKKQTICMHKNKG